MAQMTPIKMPQLSDTMTEGVLVSWEKKIGDALQRGDVVATVETDKAIMDVEVFREGYLSGPLAAKDIVIAVGQAIGYIAASVAEVSREASVTPTADQAASDQAGSPSAAKAGSEPASAKAASHPRSEAAKRPAPGLRPAPAFSGEPASRPHNKPASPYARKLAAQMQVSLENVSGRGPHGLVQADDVLSAQPVVRPSTVEAQRPAHEMPQVHVPGQGRAMSAMERATAHNMTAALTLPTYGVTMRVRPEALIATAKSRGVSFTVALTKACAVAIGKHPVINWCYQPVDKIVERAQVDIGMAVATDDGGLVVPVLRRCESRGVEELHAEWKALVERARKRRLKPEDIANPTFEISNLGMYGVTQFNAIPMPGLGAILAVAAGQVDGMALTLTSDHRVINGAEAAQFLGELKNVIEKPGDWLGVVKQQPVPEGGWDYQVAVIGAGPGGEDCARDLAAAGISVALINDAPLPGGECLWRGCIPSKAWRAAADRIRDRAGDKRLGIHGSESVKLEWGALEAERRRIIQSRAELAAKADKGFKIDYIEGRAEFLEEHKLRIRSGTDAVRELSFGAAVIAAGAPSFLPPIEGLVEARDQGTVLTSETIWGLKAPPKKLAIIGAGAIGIEMAQMFRDFGTEVLILEALPRILANMDPEISTVLLKLLQAESGLRVLTGAKVLRVDGKAGDVRIEWTTESGSADRADVDLILVAAGKRPQLDGLGLDRLHVEIERGFIKVDRQGRTNIGHIYAVGDVRGGFMLAHSASQQGRVAAAALSGESLTYDSARDCGVIFSRPQAAFAGLTVEQAKAAGFQPVDIKLPIATDAVAQIRGETEGFARMVADSDSGRLLGVHLLMDHADALIGEAALMVACGLSLQQVANTIHPHPTQSEVFPLLARRLLSRLARKKTSVAG